MSDPLTPLPQMTPFDIVEIPSFPQPDGWWPMYVVLMLLLVSLLALLYFRKQKSQKRLAPEITEALRNEISLFLQANTPARSQFALCWKQLERAKALIGTPITPEQIKRAELLLYGATFIPEEAKKLLAEIQKRGVPQ